MNLSGGDPLALAEKYMREGNRLAALPLLMEYVRRNPDSARGWWVLSFAYADPQEQLQCVDEVLRLVPDNAPARARREKILTRLSTGAGKATGQNERSFPKRSAPKNTRILQFAVLGVMAFVVVGILGAAGFMLLRGAASPAGMLQPQAQQPLGYSEISLPPTWTPTITETPSASQTPLPVLSTMAVSPTSLSAMQTSVAIGKVGPMRNYIAPDFSLINVGDNSVVTLSKFRGRAVIVFFWATWCQFCNREMPSLQMVYETYKDEGLVVLAVNVGESALEARSYKDEKNLTFPVLDDSGNGVASTYNVSGFPTHYFINPSGVITHITIGGMDYWALTEEVKSLLNLP